MTTQLLKHSPGRPRSALLLIASSVLTFCAIDDQKREFGDDNSGGAGMGGGGGKAGSASVAAGMSGQGDSDDGGAGEGGAPALGTGGEDVGGTTGEAGAPPVVTGNAGAGGQGGSGEPPEPTAGAAGAACSSRCNEVGAECESPNDCQLGFCVDGVCCESTCGGDCRACSSQLTGAADGVCASVFEDTDPHDDCADQAAATCGRNGLCNAEGECALYDSGTVCEGADCSAGIAYSERTCDGDGFCEAARQTACAPFDCGATTCESDCSSNNDCPNDAVCIADSCGPPSALLGPCDEVADCDRGDCIGGKCGLYLKSIGIKGSAVSGGGNQLFMRGWWQSDENGQNLVAVSDFGGTPRLYESIDRNSILYEPLPPDSYVLCTGAEGSDPLTRTYQFNFSDGTSVSKVVQAARSDNILLYPDAMVGSGDDYVLFHFTGADVEVLRKKF